MPLPTGIQFDIIIYALLAGVLTGVLFDLYRIIRGLGVPKGVLIVEDILFWTLSAMIIFAFLLYTNYAFLGPYVYIFMIVSLIAYLKLVSGFVIKIELKTIKFLGRIFRVIFKNISYPFKLIYYNFTGKNN